MSDQAGRNAFDVPNSSGSESTGEKPRDWRRLIMRWLPLIMLGGIILGGAYVLWKRNLLACIVLHGMIDAVPIMTMIKFGGSGGG